MSIPVLGIPYINRPDLLRRCVESIDYPVDNLVIVDNSNGSSPITFAAPSCVKHVDIITHRNAGVAGSWNEIIMLYPASFWCLVNSDIQFAPGDLGLMCDAADERGHKVGCFYANHGASFWILTEFGVENAGVLDSSIHPAYCEDCDIAVRMDRLGIIRENVQGCRSIHGDDKLTGSCAVNSDPFMREANIRTHGVNLEFYKKKWGGYPGEERFKHPFNDPMIPINYTRYQPSLRRLQQWK